MNRNMPQYSKDITPVRKIATSRGSPASSAGKPREGGMTVHSALDVVFDENLGFVRILIIQEAHKPYRSPEYQKLYSDFLSEELIYVYQQPHDRKNKNQ